MNKVLAVAVAALVVMVGALAYHVYYSPPPKFYHLDIHVANTTNIGNITVGTSNFNVLGQYLNVSLLANQQIQVQFHDYLIGPAPWYVDQQPKVFMANNKTLNVTRSFQSYVPISVITSKSNSSLTYQQFISLKPSLLKDVNANYSNIGFFYANGTPIYSWIEFYNASVFHSWSNITGDVNRTIYLAVYPQSSNLLSSTGLIGESSLFGTRNNYKLVFGNDNYAYVSNNGASTISVIDTSTNTVVATVGVGASPYGVAIHISILNMPDITIVNQIYPS